MGISSNFFYSVGPAGAPIQSSRLELHSPRANLIRSCGGQRAFFFLAPAWGNQRQNCATAYTDHKDSPDFLPDNSWQRIKQVTDTNIIGYRLFWNGRRILLWIPSFSSGLSCHLVSTVSQFPLEFLAAWFWGSHDGIPSGLVSNMCLMYPACNGYTSVPC